MKYLSNKQGRAKEEACKPQIETNKTKHSLSLKKVKLASSTSLAT